MRTSRSRAIYSGDRAYMLSELAFIKSRRLRGELHNIWDGIALSLEFKRRDLYERSLLYSGETTAKTWRP